MTPVTLIGEYPAADDRQQMGRFLRYAFPLGLASFTDVPSVPKNEQAKDRPQAGV